MTNKNIQMKNWKNGEWDKLYPVTNTSNVINSEGKNIDTIIDDNNNKTDLISSEISDINTEIEDLNNELVVKANKSYVDNEITSLQNTLRKTIVMVTDFGADSEGQQGSSQSINDAIQYVGQLGGGKVIVPPGKYLVDDIITMVDNLHLEIRQGATLKKAKTGVMFDFPSHGKGYDGGIKNVVWGGGGTISGDFDGGYGGIVTSLHHAKNIVIENLRFYETMYISHTFDLSGCKDIIIKNCIFEGFKPSPREYVECIQIDYSSYPGLTTKSESERANVDGLPCENIVVEGCSFNPIYTMYGDIQYFAPNPMGTHSQWGNVAHKNIVFKNNSVIDGIPESVKTKPYLGSKYAGLIRLQLVDGLYIYNNNFISTTGHATGILAVFPQTDVNDMSSVSQDDVVTKTLSDSELKGCDNVEIVGNIIKGFTNSIKNSTGIELFNVQGASTEFGLTKSVVYKDNTIRDCYPSDKFNLPSPQGQDVFSASDVESVSVISNDAYSVRRLIRTNRCKSIVVEGNTIDKADHVAIEVAGGSNEETDAVISNNMVTRTRVAIGVNARSRTIVNNNISSVGTTPPDLDLNGGSMIKCIFGRVVVTGNIMRGVGSKGIFIHNNVQGGLVKNNDVTGYTENYDIVSSNVDSDTI